MNGAHVLKCIIFNHEFITQFYINCLGLGMQDQLRVNCLSVQLQDSNTLNTYSEQ